jgi:pimeloyl-ACP methyl ester carboxylesterase
MYGSVIRGAADTASADWIAVANGSPPINAGSGSASILPGKEPRMASSAIIPNSDIALDRDGAGDRVVVFMHGWTDDLHVWSPVITELSASGFETVRFDLAGFGDRTQANGPFTFDRFAADLMAVVDSVAAHRAARRRGRLDQPLPGQQPRDRSGRKVSRG